ncbi:MAG TPA: ATP-binding cassette domain-containing protein [Bauldia sp.]|nr:ATP-binding cassette domain-containing protein [Bauldia sp.]
MVAGPEIEAAGLSIDYAGAGGSDLPALRGIDLAVPAGAFVAVLGPSGSGKTTLLNAFAGFVRPSTGSVRFRGRPIEGPSVERAVVFQRHALLPWLDVTDNIAFPLKLRGIDRRRRRQMVAPLVIRVGLAEFAEHPVWTLSGGMQQRVGLARALAADPAVLLLDEPLGALDAITREDMQGLLLDLWAASGKTLFLITHDIEEALFLATDLIVLSDRPGRIVGRYRLPFSGRVAAGDDGRAVRSDAGFGALKAELRDLMHRSARSGPRTLEAVD